MTSTTDMAGHPDVAEISDLTEGLLEPSRTADIQRHLDECELCADVHASLEEIRGLLGSVPGPTRMPADVAERIDAALHDADERVAAFQAALADADRDAEARVATLQAALADAEQRAADLEASQSDQDLERSLAVANAAGLDAERRVVELQDELEHLRARTRTGAPPAPAHDDTYEDDEIDDDLDPDHPLFAASARRERLVMLALLFAAIATGVAIGVGGLADVLR